MENNRKEGRRALFQSLGISGVGMALAGILPANSGKAARVSATPPQTEGPFYPVRDRLDKDADMTLVAGQSEMAKGQVVTVEGRVLDSLTGQVLAGALVEFWQACATGKYDHPADPNTAELDPNFQYWAQVQTDDLGRFAIKTIIPGSYPASSDWVRPPHIHVKVHAAGYPLLTTQLYFRGNALNAEDKILQDLSAEDQELVMLDVNGERLASPIDIRLLRRGRSRLGVLPTPLRPTPEL